MRLSQSLMLPHIHNRNSWFWKAMLSLDWIAEARNRSEESVFFSLSQAGYGRLYRMLVWTLFIAIDNLILCARLLWKIVAAGNWVQAKTNADSALDGVHRTAVLMIPRLIARLSVSMGWRFFGYGYALYSNKRLSLKNWFVSNMDVFALGIIVANDIFGLHEEEEEVEDIWSLTWSRMKGQIEFGHLQGYCGEWLDMGIIANELKYVFWRIEVRYNIQVSNKFFDYRHQ